MSVKRPNAIIYFIAYILIYPLLKLLFRLEIDRKNYDPIKGPFVAVSNHISFMDFLIVMLSLYPRRVNAITAQKFFFYRPLDKLLPMMGCIPKNLFDPDIRSIIGIKEVVNRGDNILLFPEGRCTVAGDYMGIHKSTGKLIKKLGIPVISCHVEGAYTCMPFWRKGLRFGRERVTIAELFSAEQLKSLTIDEINEALDARLGGLDSSPPKKPLCTFRAKRLAEGLHNVLYWCPSCGREFTLETQGNIIHCTACGTSAEMDKAAKLIPVSGETVPETVQDWYREQSRYEAQQLHEDMEPISVRVDVRMPLKAAEGIDICGNGMLRLSPGGWDYAGTLSGEDVNIHFPIESVPALPFDPGDNFQIYANGHFYAFTPEDKRLCSKFATIGECVYWRFTPRCQMTPSHNSGFSGSPESDEAGTAPIP
jgi:1-acyl-sn-glycerol-3-phosphate acyltransferase/ribosomal protein L37AE/L43A